MAASSPGAQPLRGPRGDSERAEAQGSVLGDEVGDHAEPPLREGPVYLACDLAPAEPGKQEAGLRRGGGRRAGRSTGTTA